MNLLIVLLPFLIVLSHIVGLLAFVRNAKFINFLHSFAAGFSIGYVFLILLPELDILQAKHNMNLLFFSLVGFTFFHLTHKFAFISEHDNKEGSLADWIHLVIIGVYNFLLSFALVSMVINGVFSTYIMVAIIVVHSSLSEFIRRISTESKATTWKVFVIMFSAALGSFLPIYGHFYSTSSVILIALAAGSIVYVSIREEIPNDIKGRPIAFLLGIVTIMLLSI